MSPMTVDPLRVLRALATCPTAPFHEAYVAARARALCGELGLICAADEFGNLLVRPATAGAAAEPVRIVFCAHMDHPGLEVISAEGDGEGSEDSGGAASGVVRDAAGAGEAPALPATGGRDVSSGEGHVGEQRHRFTGRLLGSVDERCFRQPVPVRFVTPAGEIRGRITGSFAVEDETRLRLEAAQDLPVGTLGVFDVGGFREEGELLMMPAADDLAGCAAIIAALAECRGRGITGAMGALTRAEEVSLVGATLLARSGRLPKDAVIVSIETSRPRPGAEMGGGPVIRVGDYRTAFHPVGEQLLRRAAERLAHEQPEMPVQRQLMDGGTCETTPFLLHGYLATGVAVPLGNFHNMTPDYTIAAEYIHRRDFLGCAALLLAAAEEAAAPARPHPLRKVLDTRADEVAGRLTESAAGFR